MHDGFYLRMDLGLVLASTHVTANDVAHPSYSVGGAGLGLDALIGGTPSVGLTIGGALSFQGFGHSNGSSANLGMLGVFVDGFPTPNKGLHFGGLLGLASNRTQRPNNVDEFRGRGLGLAAWTGYDWWVADEWSMGGMLRFSGALTRDKPRGSADGVEFKGSSYELAFLFTVLYH